MSNIDLTPIFQAIIALLAVLITTRLIPWIQSKTSKNQQDALITAARIAVLAAEQVIGSGHGQEKLEYALRALNKAGFNLDRTLAAAAVEKAVRDLNLFKSYQGAVPEAAPDAAPEAVPEAAPASANPVTVTVSPDAHPPES